MPKSRQVRFHAFWYSIQCSMLIFKYSLWFTVMQQEENNMLKIQNEELSNRLQRAETILSRVKEELARYRASVGRTPYLSIDGEQLLNNKLQVSGTAFVFLCKSRAFFGPVCTPSILKPNVLDLSLWYINEQFWYILT